MTISFDGRVAVVTGGGRGLGRAYALELARRGARVVVNDLGGAIDGTGGEASAADAVVGEIAAAGGEAVASYDSVATPEGGEAVVQAAVDAFGRVDALINNAGILRDKSLGKLEPGDLEAVLDVHLRGAFHTTLPAFRRMKEQGYGRLLYTTSAAGLFGNFGQSNYGAAKMGLVGLAKVVALEGAKSDVKANVISPVATTRLTEGLLTPDVAAKLGPEHVAPMSVYLVSEDCAVSGEVFSAGGGRYARAFVGVTPGWFSDAGATVEDIAANLDAVRAEQGYLVPGNAFEELALLSQHTG